MKKKNTKNTKKTAKVVRYNAFVELTNDEALAKVNYEIEKLVNKYKEKSFVDNYKLLDEELKVSIAKYSRYIHYSGLGSELGTWGDISFYISFVKEDIKPVVETLEDNKEVK